jgi:bifunctional DNA-binding transcriptional regulator/antitoxin component of YhaV-PrlF toxin-antitoxin module
MNYLATITSKRQLTIPVALYQQMNFRKGLRVVVYKTDNGMKIESALSLVDRLAGSVKIPKRFKNLTTDQIVAKAKKEYFRRK